MGSAFISKSTRGSFATIGPLLLLVLACSAKPIEETEKMLQSGKVDSDITGGGEGEVEMPVCPSGGELCPKGQRCQFDPAQGVDICVEECGINNSECGSRVCCPVGSECVSGGCQLPNLTALASRMFDGMYVSNEMFGVGSCEMEEQCVSGPGLRKLLHFTLATVNYGPGNLVTGAAEDNPLFNFSECHQHYHFTNFAMFQLIDKETNQEAVPGQKQSFCLIPTEQLVPGSPPGNGVCNELPAGWADIYGAGTPCQWLDITDVPAGDYALVISVNPDHIIAEADFSDNIVQSDITIPECGNGTCEEPFESCYNCDDCPTAPEFCDGLDNDCNGILDDGFDVFSACDGPDGDLCEYGVLTCTADGLDTECSDSFPVTETCGNGYDDDCNPATPDEC